MNDKTGIFRALQELDSGVLPPKAFKAVWDALKPLVENLEREGVACALSVDNAQLRPGQAEGAQGERCTSCDGTGDLTRQDGEWMGYCVCAEGEAQKNRAALAQPSPKCAICGYDNDEPCPECPKPSTAPELVGRSVSVDVSTGDHDVAHRIFAEVVEVAADGTLLCEKAQDNGDVQAPELERPEVVTYAIKSKPRFFTSDPAADNLKAEAVEALMTVAQHDRIVGALRAEAADAKARQEHAESVGDNLANALKAAQARVAELENQEPVAWMHSRSGAVATDATKRAMEDGSVPSGYDVPLYAAPVAQAGQVPEGCVLIRREAIEYLADQWPGAYRRFYERALLAAAPAQGGDA